MPNDTIMRRLTNMSKKKPFIGVLIAFLAASVIMLVTSVVVSIFSGYGIELAMACFRLADGWVFGGLLLSALSLIERIKEERLSVEYACGLVFVVLALLSFFVAITSGSKSSVLVGFICFVLFAVCSCAVPRVISHFKGKPGAADAGDEADKDGLQASDFEKQWTLVRARLAKMSGKEKKVKLLENTLLYLPKDLDINNGLDFSEPLISVGDEIYTVAAAEKKNAVSKIEIDTAKALIENLVKEEN